MFYIFDDIAKFLESSQFEKKSAGRFCLKAVKSLVVFMLLSMSVFYVLYLLM